MRDDAWKPKPPPKDGYPRLVRAHYKGFTTHGTASKDDLVNRLAALSRHYPTGKFPSKVLKREVLELAEEYGPIDAPEFNTIWGWVKAGLEAYAHIEAMGALEAGGLDRLRGYLDEQDAPWREAFAVAALKRRKSKEAQRTASTLKATPTQWWARWYGPWDHLLYFAIQAEDKRAFKQLVAEDCLTTFGLGLGDVEFSLSGLHVYCGARRWLYHELSQAWNNGAPLGKCEGCGRPFLKTSANRKYCDTKKSRCRVRKHGKSRPEVDL